MSDERLRVKLVTYGYEEKTVLTWEREDLLARYAEVMTAEARPKVGPVAADSEVKKMRLELKRQKLEFEMRQAEAETIERERQIELEKQKLEFKAQKAKSERVKRDRQGEKQDVLKRERLAFERHEKEKQLELEKQRIELKNMKAESKKQKWMAEKALKKVQSEKEKTRQNDGAVSAKKYADAIRKCIVPMGLDQIDAVAFFQRAEKLFVSYGIPKELQANLIGPYLNQNAKQIWARLSPEVTSVYDDVKGAILREMKLSAAAYLQRFNTCVKTDDETYCHMPQNCAVC